MEASSYVSTTSRDELTQIKVELVEVRRELPNLEISVAVLRGNPTERGGTSRFDCRLRLGRESRRLTSNNFVYLGIIARQPLVLGQMIKPRF